MTAVEAAFVGSFVVTLALAAAVRPLLARAGFVDLPNARSSHAVPTIRGGGVSFASVIVAAAYLLGTRSTDRSLITIAEAAFVIAATSLLDDARGLSIRVRLAVQAAAAMVPATIAFLPDGPSLPMRLGLGLVAFVWTVGFTNAFNFMDGINGIATTHAVVTAGMTAAFAWKVGLRDVALLALVVSGASAGFLPWNFPRARMFMGDVGSATLGFVLAALAVRIASPKHWELAPSLVLVHAGFVLDTGITIVRRALRGENLGTPHRDHFYQRLVRSGTSHAAVTFAYATLTAASAGVGFLIAGRAARDAAPFVLGVALAWLGFFGFAEHRFQRASSDQGSR